MLFSEKQQKCHREGSVGGDIAQSLRVKVKKEATAKHVLVFVFQ